MIKKLGTIDIELVEATPIVFNGKLYRFEYVRHPWYKPNQTGDTYFRFIDVETGEPTPSFAVGYHLGTAHVEGDTIYVFGVDAWGGNEVRVWWSKDFKTWESQVGIMLPGWGAYNNSVCKGDGRYVMALELGEPEEAVGERFTMCFLESDDLINWHIIPDVFYSKDRYTACPVIRHLDDGYYYMIYLEALKNWHLMPSSEWWFVPHIIRSRNLADWESSPRNPIAVPDNDDKKIANPKFTLKEREHIANAVNINVSDFDINEFQGKTIIYYSWGDQIGVEFLAEAVYEGTMESFLHSYFPE